MFLADAVYGATFGKCDGSDAIDTCIELNDEEEKIYKRAIMLRLPFDEFPELCAALERAGKEIAEEEAENLAEMGDEYALECLGQVEVEPDHINELVRKRDAHTLAFFDLEGLSDEELDAWDANELDELPYVCDFEENFEPESPFDGGYDIDLEFSEMPEELELDEEEAAETIELLLKEANGDYAILHDYIERCDTYLYNGITELKAIANEKARDLELNDFAFYEDADEE